MVCGRHFGPLNKFLKLAPEHKVHLQLPGDLFSSVQALRAPCIEIRFLQEKDVCICACEESTVPCRCCPRSMFQPTMPSELGGHITQRKGAKLPVTIPSLAAAPDGRKPAFWSRP